MADARHASAQLRVGAGPTVRIDPGPDQPADAMSSFTPLLPCQVSREEVAAADWKDTPKPDPGTTPQASLRIVRRVLHRHRGRPRGWRYPEDGRGDREGDAGTPVSGGCSYPAAPRDGADMSATIREMRDTNSSIRTTSPSSGSSPDRARIASCGGPPGIASGSSPSRNSTADSASPGSGFRASPPALRPRAGPPPPRARGLPRRSPRPRAAWPP